MIEIARPNPSCSGRDGFRSGWNRSNTYSYSSGVRPYCPVCPPTCGEGAPEGNRYSWDHRGAVAGITGGLGTRELGRSDDCDHRADSSHGNPLIVVDMAGKTFTARCTFQGAGAGTGTPCASRPANADRLPSGAGGVSRARESRTQSITIVVTLPSTPYRGAAGGAPDERQPL